MGYSQNKNIVMYKGTIYNIILDLNTKNFTTNHPDGNKFIEKTLSSNANSPTREKYLMYCYYVSDGKINPFIETICKCLDMNTLYRIFREFKYYWQTNRINNDLIELYKQKWKKVLQVQDKWYNYDFVYTHFDFEDLLIFADTANFNETERKAFCIIPNEKIVKHFAGQLVMYEKLINWSQFKESLERLDGTEYEVPLTNKNLLQYMKNVIETDTKCRDILSNRLFNENYYNKYNWLEKTGSDGWKFSLLTSIKDVQTEAEEMDNCLYNRYLDNIIEGESIIVVAITPDGKRIDLELSPDLILEQCFYKSDKKVSQEHLTFLRNWTKSLRDGNK